MKQLEHVKSLMILVRNGQDRDAGLIARTMLEGMAVLLWASHSKERAFNWRAYSLVADLKSRSEDRGTDPKLDMLLKKHGHIFKTKKFRNMEAEGKELPYDPYGKNWAIDEKGKHMQRSDIFEYLDDKDLYGVYSTLSQWEHWTPTGIGQCLVNREESTTYVDGSPSAAAMALAVGFQAMYHTLEVLCSHTNTRCKHTIEGIRDRYIKAITENKT